MPEIRKNWVVLNLTELVYYSVKSYKYKNPASKIRSCRIFNDTSV